MTPIFVWIYSGEIVGIGDTRRDALEDAQESIEKMVSLFAAEGITVDAPNVHTGYGVRIRLSHYPEDADPRSVIALALKPIDDSDEIGLGLGIVGEILGAEDESEGNGEDWEALGELTNDTDILDSGDYDEKTPNDTTNQDEYEQADSKESDKEGDQENAQATDSSD